MKHITAQRGGPRPTSPARSARVRVPRWSSTGTAAALLVVALLAGCAEDRGSADDDPGTTPSPTRTETEPAVPPTSDPVNTAVEDLARRLETPPEEVEVVSTEEVTWNNGSLGCAQKGTSYTQALVPGLRITLRVDGTTYSYHQGNGKTPFLCEHPTQ